MDKDKIERLDNFDMVKFEEQLKEINKNIKLDSKKIGSGKKKRTSTTIGDFMGLKK